MQTDRMPLLVTSKLSPPAVVRAHVRPQVLEKIAAGARRRLLVVRAPAGYGKTTVIRFASQNLEWTLAWYRLDVLDHDPMTFINGLTEAVRRTFPDFGDVVIARITEAREVPLDTAQALALLIKAFENEVDQQIHLVLDDYHEAAGSHELNEALRYLVANAPTHVHFILLTRYQPAIGASRLRLDGEASEIGYEDLRLDAAQVREIVAAGGGGGRGKHISDAAIAQLLEFTEGWAASVVLAAQSGYFETADSLGRSPARPRLNQGIFAFLAEEAFRGEEPRSAAFLLSTSCLDAMSPSLAAAVSGDPDAERLLDRLATTNTFTFHDPDQDTYRYHHLFRDFLRQRFIRERGTAAYRDLQLNTAAAVERAGDPESAIELLFGANDVDRALEVLARCGDLVSETSRLDTLRSWTERIPADKREQNPWALFLQGCVLRRQGEIERAAGVLTRALRHAEAASTPESKYHLHSALEEVHFWKGNFDEAAALCRMALECAETPRERVRAHCSLGSALRYLGDVAGSRREWEAAALGMDHSSPKEAVRLESLTASALYVEGDFETAHARMVAIADRVTASLPIDLAIPFIGLIGETALEIGYLKQSEASLGECIALCDRYALAPNPDVLAVQARWDNANGEPHSARAAFERLVELPSVRESVWSQAIALDDLGTIRRQQGDISGSMLAHLQASELLCGTPPGYPHIASATSLAYVRVLSGELSAREALDAAADDADASGYWFLEKRARTFALLARESSRTTQRGGRALAEALDNHVHMGHIAFLATEIAADPELGRQALDAGAGRIDLVALCTKLFRLPIAAKAIASRFPLEADAALSVIEAADAIDDVEARAAILSAASKHASRKVRTLGRNRATPANARDHSGVLGLTRRETQVLGLMADGHRNPEIAEALFLSEKTVKTHVNRIFSKLGARDRVHAVLLYHERTGTPSIRHDR